MLVTMAGVGSAGGFVQFARPFLDVDDLAEMEAMGLPGEVVVISRAVGPSGTSRTGMMWLPEHDAVPFHDEDAPGEGLFGRVNLGRGPRPRQDGTRVNARWRR